MNPYLFTSHRLGFRNWLPTDIGPLAAINADKDVMEFFPATKTLAETLEFIGRMQRQLADKGYCYFAVDTLHDAKFIGFIGISEQTFPSPFTPCIDIGWRLSSQVWQQGYATEGALRCLRYASDNLNIKKICAVAPCANTRSERIMLKIGMNKVTEFIHPLLIHDTRLRDCVLYQVEFDGK